MSELECTVAERDGIIAELRQKLSDDSREYRQFRDSLAPCMVERAAQLAIESPEEFGALATRLHWLRRDLLEACAGVHIADSPSTPPDYRTSDVRSPEASASRPHGEEGAR